MFSGGGSGGFGCPGRPGFCWLGSGMAVLPSSPSLARSLSGGSAAVHPPRAWVGLPLRRQAAVLNARVAAGGRRSVGAGREHGAAGAAPSMCKQRHQRAAKTRAIAAVAASLSPRHRTPSDWHELRCPGREPTTVRIGVALSSGGAAGLAHIGVLEELVQAGIEIECVAGTSAGAMVGAAFASGHLEEFRDRVMSWSRRRRVSLFDPIWPRNGLLGGRRAMELLGSCATGAIEDLPLRYAAVATDLDSGQLVVLRSGDVCQAIRASIAVPGVFTPQLWHGRRLVDGALLDPVPVGPANELGATFVIAVSVIGTAETLVMRRDDPQPARFRRLLARVWRSASPALGTVTAVPYSAMIDAEPVEEHSDGLATILCKASMVVQT